MLKLELVVTLVCTEVIRYNISAASICSSAITIFAQQVYRLFQSRGGGGWREAMNESLGPNLISSVIKVALLLPPSLYL